MIVCPRCSKENQDHYKFCLGCGSELPRDAAAPKEFRADTPPNGVPAVGAAPEPAADKNLEFARTQQGDASVLDATSNTEEPPPPVAEPPRVSTPASAQPFNCPSCANPVPLDFKFCGTCGHRMDGDEAEGAPAAGAAPAPEAAAAARGSLTLINPDGSEGDSYPLSDGVNSIGREAGGVFGTDAYLSPVHATFDISGAACKVSDQASLNGVFVKLERDTPTRLVDGSVFRIGQEIMCFADVPAGQEDNGVEPMGSPNPGYIGKVSLVIGRATSGNAFPIPPDGMHIGRERGDITFPEDGYVSGLHCRLHDDGSGVVLTDVGSSNGTFIRIEEDTSVNNGDLLLMGQQLCRLQY